jgi:hypothetical protein
VTAVDPTFTGNQVVAYLGGVEISRQDFAFSGQPGVNIPDSKVIAGPLDRLDLIPAPADYVAYTASITTASGESVRIQPVSGDLIVRPQQTGDNTLTFEVGVYDPAGNAIPNRTVQFALDGIEQTGGHQHGGTMPPGSLSQSSVNTGPTGVSAVTYSAAVFGGQVQIRGTSGTAEASDDTITVAVPGLTALGGSDRITLIGQTETHPSNHWGSAGMTHALGTLADSIHARYDVPIEVNDISLELGGKFDLASGYGTGGSHAEHRVGTSADLRTFIFEEAQLRYLRRVWENLGGQVLDETRTDQPHYHLRFPEE